MKNSNNISWICKQQKNDLFKCSSLENFSEIKIDNSKVRESDKDKINEIKKLNSKIKNIKDMIKKNESLLETLKNL